MQLLQAINEMGDKLRSVFSSSPGAASGMPNANIRYNLYQLIDSESEIARVQRFQKLYDYYVNDEKRIKGYLRTAMERTFATDTLNEIQYPYYNITRRVIDRLCLAYKLPAERYVVAPHNPDGTENASALKDQEAFQNCLSGSNINAQAKRWHRYARLLDTVYVGVVWREDHIEYDVFPPHLISVLECEDNYLKPAGVMFRKLRRHSDGSTELVSVFWSEDDHSVLDSKGRPITGDDMPDGKNPYGLIPYIPLRMRECENHWGEGDSQLVDINEQINILLASSLDNAIMQSHGQPVAINMGLDGKILTGPKHIIQVDRASSDFVNPSFEFKTPAPAIRECMDMVDWMLKRTAIDHGLPPASVSLEEKATSGASKAIDNWELIEARQDDIELLRPFEKKLFEITRAVWNYHNSSEKISDQAVFGIDFTEIEMPQSEKDVLDVKAKKLGLGLWTPVEDLIDEDEGIDEAIALGIVQKNLEIRNALNDQYGIATLTGLFPSEEKLKTAQSGEAESGNTDTTEPTDNMTTPVDDTSPPPGKKNMEQAHSGI